MVNTTELDAYQLSVAVAISLDPCVCECVCVYLASCITGSVVIRNENCCSPKSPTFGRIVDPTVADFDSALTTSLKPITGVASHHVLNQQIIPHFPFFPLRHTSHAHVRLGSLLT